ncbi:hypothetical protein ciss_01990 [Carboxydothermus islandicus]|uniref:Uncharacterized protein n=1 Tax=Carboxydothermus islandicus TaxID=661089 RepID=A0A1L8CZ97_9THEO|nr:hypothetical protein ciss_01990 [Carboxydothermus islandicus]
MWDGNYITGVVAAWFEKVLIEPLWDGNETVDGGNSGNSSRFNRTIVGWKYKKVRGRLTLQDMF